MFNFQSHVVAEHLFRSIPCWTAH